jgi:hypothetical protein
VHWSTRATAIQAKNPYEATRQRSVVTRNFLATFANVLVRYAAHDVAQRNSLERHLYLAAFIENAGGLVVDQVARRQAGKRQQRIDMAKPDRAQLTEGLFGSKVESSEAQLNSLSPRSPGARLMSCDW